MTLQQFKDWAIAQGSVAKATDGQYLGECVSLINQYLYKVYGISAGAWGHARAWANDTNPIRANFDKVGSPQAGDIGVSHGPTEYGHIWIYLSPNLILEQNGRVPRRVSTGTPYLSTSAILRRKGSPTNPPEVMDMTDKNFINNVYLGVLGRLAWNPSTGAWFDEGAKGWLAYPKDVFLQKVLESKEYQARVERIKQLEATGGNFEPVTEQLFKKKAT